jgi:hypothetical protein
LKVNLCSVRKHVADAPVVPIYANPWFRSMQSGISQARKKENGESAIPARHFFSI